MILHLTPSFEIQSKGSIEPLHNHTKFLDQEGEESKVRADRNPTSVRLPISKDAITNGILEVTFFFLEIEPQFTYSINIQ